MLDSGFTGLCVVGAETFGQYQHNFTRVRDIKTSKFTYTFGAGNTYPAKRTCIITHPSFGSTKCDVVVGSLPFLFGREFLKYKKVLMNFAKDYKIIDGTKSQFAFKIPLKSLEESRSSNKYTGTSTVNNRIEAEFSSQGVTAKPVTDPQASGRSTVPASATDGASLKCRSARRESSVNSENGRHKSEKLTRDFEKKSIEIEQHDCACCDFNVYTALEATETVSPDREVEEAILRGWMGARENHGQPDTELVKIQDGNANRSASELERIPLRKRTGNHTVISLQQAVEIERIFPSPVWKLQVGLLRKLHFLRHAPAIKMYTFVFACIPPRAKSKKQAYKIVETFMRNVKLLCEEIVRLCQACNLNSRDISRPISLSVVPPFAVGMIDTMVLDYSQRLYALVVADLGTGMCWGYVIRDRCPPDSIACFVTYYTRYASVFGPHKMLCADRDSIFSSKEAMLHWQQLGVERETIGAYAHFSMGSVERRIGMFRWSIDRIRVSTPPNSVAGWEVCLATIGNSFFNESDFSGTSPSLRISGFQTHVLRNALTDTMVTATGTNENLEIAEQARETYEHARADRRLRKMIASNMPAHNNEQIFPPGTKVAYFREKGEPPFGGPAWVIGYVHPTGKYQLSEGHRHHFADKDHVRLWIEDQDGPISDLDPHRPKTTPLENPHEDAFQLTGAHPRDPPVDESELATDPSPSGTQPLTLPSGPKTPDVPPGLDFRELSLIHDPANRPDLSKITCGRCLGRNQKHAHIRKPGCRLYDPDDPRTWHRDLLGGVNQGDRFVSKKYMGYKNPKTNSSVPAREEMINIAPADPNKFVNVAFTAGSDIWTIDDVLKWQKIDDLKYEIEEKREQERKQKDLDACICFNTSVSKKQKKKEKNKLINEVGEEVYASVITKENLLNDFNEDLRFIDKVSQSTYLGAEISELESTDVGTESKYLYKWADLPEEKKRKAYLKAIAAYEKHQSWFKGSEMTDEEFKRMRREYPETVGLDCTIVRDAKLKCGEIIGKVRIAPRGFRDHTDKGKWFSTSPTASAVSIRISEMLGMKWGLKSYIFDISDAFFSGEELRSDEYMYIKVPREILEIEGSDPNRPWRRLRREVPGCKGASSSWFRVFSSKLISWGFEQLTTDPALFVKRDAHGQPVAILPVHVDDGKLRATAEFAEWFFAKLKAEEHIELSSREDQKLGTPIEFTGMSFTETEFGETIDQNVYISNKLENVDLTKFRHMSSDDQLAPADAKTYGTCVGRLIWLLPTQVKFSYEISFLSRFRAYPRVKHMKRIAELIKAIKKDPQYIFLPKLSALGPIKIITVVDAGAGEEADPPLKTRDHQCVAILMAGPSDPNATAIPPGSPVKVGILSWQSCGVSRVSHASFDFEAISAVSSLDYTFNVKEIVGEVVNGPCPYIRQKAERLAWRAALPSCELHSDSMGLVKSVRLGVTQGLASRRRRDISDLRDCMSCGDLEVMIHVDGKTNPVDVGTKSLSRTQEGLKETLKIVNEGFYQPKQSSDHQNTFGVSTAVFYAADLQEIWHAIPSWS